MNDRCIPTDTESLPVKEQLAVLVARRAPGAGIYRRALDEIHRLTTERDEAIARAEKAETERGTMNNRKTVELNIPRSAEERIIAYKEWHCAGCGVPVHDLVKRCDCMTMVACKEGHESVWMIDPNKPDIETQLSIAKANTEFIAGELKKATDTSLDRMRERDALKGAYRAIQKQNDDLRADIERKDAALREGHEVLHKLACFVSTHDGAKEDICAAMATIRAALSEPKQEEK